MKYISYLLLLFLLVAAGTEESKALDWKHAKIEVDSLQPCKLFFFDSLNGIFLGMRVHPYYNSYWHATHYPIKLFWFRTSDGGASWNRFEIGNGYQDTSANSFSFIHYYLNQILHSEKTVYVVHPNLDGDSVWNTRKNSLYISISKGQVWENTGIIGDTSINSSYGEFSLMGTLANNLLYKYDHQSGLLHLSDNYGKTFPHLLSDSVFRSVVLWSADTGSKITNFGSSYSDFGNFTFVNNGLADSPTSDSSLTGLTTLVANNSGLTWERHNFILPGFEDRMIHGNLQYIPKTPVVYLFTSPTGLEGLSNETIGISSGQKELVNYSDSYLNTSFLHSTDYGRTWTPNHSFGNRRRGFEAVADGEILMTVTNSSDFDAFGRVASVIAHTTNNGQTWSLDSSTLGNFFEREIDGRIITLSQNRLWIAAWDGRNTHIFRHEKKSLSVSDGRQNQEFRLKLYPNPSSDFVTVLVDKSETIKTIQIFDALGREVRTPVKFLSKSSAEVSTHDYPIGYYLLRVILNRGPRFMGRLIISR